MTGGIWLVVIIIIFWQDDRYTRNKRLKALVEKELGRRKPKV